MTFMQVIEEVKKFGNVQGVTLTGGEPFVQKVIDIDWLIYELKGAGYFVNIETNGVYLPKLKNGNLVDRFSISPKLASSINKKAIIYPTLEKYLEEYAHKMFFKFVISDASDFKSMVGILNKLKVIRERNIPIIVQPNIDDRVVSDIKQQNKRFLKLLNLVLEDFSHYSKLYNIKIIPQFHKYLWLAKKGV